MQTKTNIPKSKPGDGQAAATLPAADELSSKDLQLLDLIASMITKYLIEKAAKSRMDESSGGMSAS